MKHLNKKLKIITVILVAALITVGLVYAASVTIWSNPVTVTPQPTPPPTTLTLTVNTTTPYVGESILLTATLSTGASGVTVAFWQNNVTHLGSSVTVAGVATWITLIGNTNVKVYNATCTV